MAFYPGCRSFLNKEGWYPDGPLLMLLAEKDDWTPSGFCVELSKRDLVRDRTEAVVYPDAYHGFDAPDAPLRQRRDLPNVPDGTAHFGTDESARKDSIGRVTKFLQDNLRG
ncbi:dienelactone hydrolase family protein [Azospirillum thermophilum]|uniref:dienelactone hydrolase family protein n=1 Tax=Azospirillum thermophilum TaxID=2202148 RepID=UPI001FE2B51C|nr:hypothetical protein [Azospirillum thermophilum]